MKVLPFIVALPPPSSSANCLGTYFFKEVFSTPGCFCFSTKPLFIPLSLFKGSFVFCSLINVSIPQRLCYMLPQLPTKQSFLSLPPQTTGLPHAALSEQKHSLQLYMTNQPRSEHDGAVHVEGLTDKSCSYTSN